MYYKKGFYDPKIGTVPDGALEITDARYRELLAGQAAGQIITQDANGYPILADPPARSRAELIEILRARIDAKTDAEIIGGFVFEGKRFKLSLENQFNYKAEVELADQLTYPHRIKSIDGYFDVPDAAAYRRFYLAAVGYIRATVETGWAAKDELDDLTDAELAAELLEA